MKSTFKYRLKRYRKNTAEKAAGKSPYACMDHVQRFICSKEFDAGDHDKGKQGCNQS